MEETIICGVDGSRDSLEAVRAASALSERLGARLILAHVTNPIDATVAFAEISAAGGLRHVPMSVPQAEVERQAAEAILETATAAAGVAHAEQGALSGNPADRLAALADEETATFIVVGARGYGGLKTLFLGSVSNSLIGVARCPVVVVPPGVTQADS